MLLAERNPSPNWEPIAFAPQGQCAVWVWFRPATLPTGLMISIPFAAFAEPSTAGLLTIRQLVTAMGLEASQVLGWSVNGYQFEGAAGTSPMLDQVLPAPAPDGQTQVAVWMEMSQPGMWAQAAPVPQAMPTASAGSPLDARYFDAIDSCWNGIRQQESKVGSIRKQLDQLAVRLNSLNRDLTPEERRASDNKDTKDWLDARRWLRDSLATLTRSIKEIDMGTTSGAGQRHRFEDIHRQFVAPRIPFTGLEHAVIEFESYSKTLQNVISSAQAAITRASRDGEQRANGVLTRIGMKSRSTRRKE